MWFVVVACLMIAAAVLGPRFGVKSYESRWPSVRGTELPPDFGTRVSFGLIGVLMILFGTYTG